MVRNTEGQRALLRRCAKLPCHCRRRSCAYRSCTYRCDQACDQSDDSGRSREPLDRSTRNVLNGPRQLQAICHREISCTHRGGNQRERCEARDRPRPRHRRQSCRCCGSSQWLHLAAANQQGLAHGQRNVRKLQATLLSPSHYALLKAYSSAAVTALIKNFHAEKMENATNRL
jgi:hypothetical protein